ncbi:MAG TPA: YihY/virulence factor BrkB family protein [Streptosporangiaceae bacterium]|nr:YihY/virulence factor BrkB family protein [Streptosporangiaceae bacterium]
MPPATARWRHDRPGEAREVAALNPAERVIRRVDQTQQRNKPAAFVFGVIKKFGDDNGGVLVGNLAHSGLVAVFPLLLVLVTLLGLIASSDPSVRHAVLDAVAKDFPLVGNQLAGNVHRLRRSSVIGLVIGLLSLIWGATGLAQAGLFTMAQVWNLPGPARPGYLQRLGRAVLFLGVLGLGVVVTTLLTGLTSFGHNAAPVAAVAELLAALANIGMYFIGFRVLTPAGVPSRKLLPGAVVGGLGWTLLQALGTYLVRHYLTSDSVYGVFATVLGLVAWIYLGVEVTVYAAEVNVVLARRLWPRAIVQPPLTEADRASMALQALQNQRREEQQVNVFYADRPAGVTGGSQTPETPDDVAPPAESPPVQQARSARPAGPGPPAQPG